MASAGGGGQWGSRSRPSSILSYRDAPKFWIGLRHIQILMKQGFTFLPAHYILHNLHNLHNDQFKEIAGIRPILEEHL